MEDKNLSLEEATAKYSRNIYRITYRGTKMKYCTDIRIGEGTFGKVYKGWNDDGSVEMAVKIIDQSYLNQEYRARENLEREINIMKRLKGCENVVQIFMAAQLKIGVIITMELCDGDLHSLLKIKKSFEEQEIVDFLHQLGEGMKELRKHNIVHRDIKPQNILYKRRDPRIIYKLCDFGYARHYDSNRAMMMMNTVVGTPLYMAPEAIQVYLYPDEKLHYNDKVDVWSIGALLYKVLVGTDAFPATTIYHIYEFLKGKGDNIAFELTTKKGKPTYIDELPGPARSKLSPSFCQAITELLVGMLKIDAKERISFPIFFEKIEDIIESKIELVNLLHGTSIKFMSDPCMTPEVLLSKASSRWDIPQEQVVIFSPVYPKYIGAHQQITDEEFTSLLEKSGGQEGHARLYILTLQHLKEDDPIDPDMSCFEPLQSALEEHQASHLIKNQRFMDEIMYMIECLKTQLKNQRESVNTLYQFAINETGMSASYNNLKKEVHQMLSKVSVTNEMLQKDLEWCETDEETCLPELMQKLTKKELQLREVEMEFEVKTITLPEDPFHWKDTLKNIKQLVDMTKKVQVGDISNNCQKLYDYCRDMIADKTGHTRLRLNSYTDVLESTWSLYSKSSIVGEMSELLTKIKVARKELFESRMKPRSQADPLPLPSLATSVRDYTAMLQELRHENEELRKTLTKEVNSGAKTKKKFDEALLFWKSSELAIKQRDRAGDSRTNIVAIEKLNERLHQFCQVGNQVLLVSKTEAVEISQAPAAEKGQSTNDDSLMIKAKDLASEICGDISNIRKDDTLVKIAHPEDYKAGDIVLLTPVNTLKGSVPSILHLNWKNPYMLMDFTCLKAMAVKPGKVPQLFLGKLREAPRKLDLEDYSTTAHDIGQSEGVFYRAFIDPVSMKFSDRDLTLLEPNDQQHSVLPSRGKR